MMVLLAEAIGRTKQSNGGGGGKQWKMLLKLKKKLPFIRAKY